MQNHSDNTESTADSNLMNPTQQSNMYQEKVFCNMVSVVLGLQHNTLKGLHFATFCPFFKPQFTIPFFSFFFKEYLKRYLKNYFILSYMLTRNKTITAVTE